CISAIVFVPRARVDEQSNAGDLAVRYVAVGLLAAGPLRTAKGGATAFGEDSFFCAGAGIMCRSAGCGDSRWNRGEPSRRAADDVHWECSGFLLPLFWESVLARASLHFLSDETLDRSDSSGSGGFVGGHNRSCFCHAPA